MFSLNNSVKNIKTIKIRQFFFLILKFKVLSIIFQNHFHLFDHIPKIHLKVYYFSSHRM